MKFWIVLAIAVWSCQSKPAGEKAVTGPAQGTPATTQDIEVEEMIVRSGQLSWTASKTGGQHQGTVEVKEGSLTVKGKEVLTGRLVVDMNTIKNIDLEGEKKTKLENHLRSADFFDVENYPVTEFVVTVARTSSADATATHEMTGDLTIKDITRSITVPVNISLVGDKILVATPAFTINRTEWNLNYRSGILGTAADKLIHDDVSLMVTFEAGK